MYDRDALIAATNLVALADELLGARRGNARTPTWPCPNPQHPQTGRTPPVSVFTSHRGEQRWRCHACGSGGTAIDLVMACCRTNARDAMALLARRVGHQDLPAEWAPRRPARRTTPQPPSCRDPEGLDAYVEACAEALFIPAGERVRQWLMRERGLPEAVLRANRIGADLGPRRQARPEGMPNASGAVLPALADGRAVYAQVRVLRPRSDGPRYLNPTGALAPNPRLAYYRPAEIERPELIVTEGVIDALSAAAAGFRAAAVLSAAYADQAIAHELSRLPEALVIAFDQDDAGKVAAQRLTALLDVQHHRSVALALPTNDLNDALVHSSNWPKDLRLRVDVARETPNRCLGRSVG